VRDKYCSPDAPAYSDDERAAVQKLCDETCANIDAGADKPAPGEQGSLLK
jgi:hypothetical protein